MCCLAVPFTPLSAYGNTWHLGRILCHLVPMSLGISGRKFFRVKISLTTNLVFSLCFNINIISHSCWSVFCDCSSISFAYAFGCLCIINCRHLGRGNIDFLTISDLHAFGSYKMWSKCRKEKEKYFQKNKNLYCLVGILATTYISTFLQFFVFNSSISHSILSYII